MADMFSVEKRSEIMSSIRSKNTAAERIVFSYLRKHGIYFQKHYKRAVGTPDIALPRKKLACFIDGDFWHGRDIDRIRKTQGNEGYWAKKIARNMERDMEQRNTLTDNGWMVISVWESDIMSSSRFLQHSF